jgi:hypothetical protein
MLRDVIHIILALAELGVKHKQYFLLPTALQVNVTTYVIIFSKSLVTSAKA